MPNRSWTLLGSRDILDEDPSAARSLSLRAQPRARSGISSSSTAPSWVNVVPVTAEGRVVLIRQYRHGIRDVTVEIPGGMIDAGESPEAAAARELQEETGYTAESLRLLARVLPNPAIQNNWCYLFAADGCRRTGQPRPDPFEVIEVQERPLEEVPAMIHSGEICHCMVIAAFALVGLVRPAGPRPDPSVSALISGPPPRSRGKSGRAGGCNSNFSPPATYLLGLEWISVGHEFCARIVARDGMNDASKTDEFLALYAWAGSREFYAYIRAQVLSPTDADDVLQDTAAVLWRKFAEYRAGTYYVRWARRVARLEVLAYHRHRRRLLSIFSEEVVDAVAEKVLELSNTTVVRAEALKDCVQLDCRRTIVRYWT